VAIDARPFGGGTTASRRLEPANILTSGIGLPLPPVAGDQNGIRLGTQEVTRLGMGRAQMAEAARLLADVLLARRPAEAVRADVLTLRHPFQTLRYVR
jgi:glycine hydroxymethyltransferase